MLQGFAESLQHCISLRIQFLPYMIRKTLYKYTVSGVLSLFTQI